MRPPKKTTNLTARYDDPAIARFADLRAARRGETPAERLKNLRAAARDARDALLAVDSVRFYRSFDLIRVPYPLRFALREACPLPWPLVHILNRLFVVQLETAHGVRTILVSPSDADRNQATPFFRRLQGSMGPLKGPLGPVIAPETRSVAAALALTGIAPERVDYITYDHLHTQDLRGWLGDGEHTGFFPNARLLVMREEWAAVQGLTPPQRDWYCPDGAHAIHPSRLVLLDEDVTVGGAFALVHTPGHTMGNHSIAVRTPEGVMVTSENGVCPDAYAPEHSAIPGLRRYARETGMEVVLNGNTLEGALDQYCSMVVEKTLAGPSVRRPEFPNIVASSELTPTWFAPGITPTFRFGELSFGRPS